MKEATKNILALIVVLIAFLVLVAPFVIGGGLLYAVIHFIMKFW